MVNDGTNRCSVFKNRRFEKARRYSLMPNAILLKNSLHVPPPSQRFHRVAQVKVSLAVAFALERKDPR